ncbi:MAG: RNA polymerase factor sigma-54 [Spirochaetes bacterium]|nr:RNA polymerase factor sigma-54 [Spirochaetota bacterium]
MAQGLHLGLRTAQSLAITPQMIQTLRIVQYSTPELLEHIQHELSENPFLTELPDEAATTLDPDAETARDESEHREEYGDEPIPDTPEPQQPANPDAPDRTSIIERTASREQNLEEVLMEQLGIAYHEHTEAFQVGEYIIGSLDDDGFFAPDKRSVALADLKCDPEVFDDVLGTIRSFDPPGIASADVRSCLLYQLETLEEYDTDLEFELVENHFSELQQRKAADLAKLLQRPLAEIERAIHHIGMLEPRPARRYRNVENAVIIPDVVVRRDGADFHVTVNDEILPKLAYSDEYRSLSKVKDNPELRQWMKDREEKAQLLLSSIRFRSQNLVKVAVKLLDVQRPFFEKGPSHLAPYTLTKLAEATGINQGTLSRITNTKYIETEWGVFSLKAFFSSAVAGAEGSVSSNHIREEIKAILDSFGPDVRLSDQKIAEVLAKKGFKVARRTVAKYRTKLQILSSFHR